MKKIRKICTMLIAAAVSVAAMVSTAFTASAKGVFDDAITMEPLTYYSKDLDSREVVFYRIKVPSEGKINIFCGDTVGGGWVSYAFIDAETNVICESFFVPNCMEEIRDIKKGTYYLKIIAGSDDNLFYENLYYNFIPDENSTESYDEPTAVIALRLKKGDTARVTVVTDDYDGSVRWKSTKKSVATVSKGKITAKKKGNARIRAYLDDGSYTEILVIVEN